MGMGLTFLVGVYDACMHELNCVSIEKYWIWATECILLQNRIRTTVEIIEEFQNYWFSPKRRVNFWYEKRPKSDEKGCTDRYLHSNF